MQGIGKPAISGKAVKQAVQQVSWSTNHTTHLLHLQKALQTCAAALCIIPQPSSCAQDS